MSEDFYESQAFPLSRRAHGRVRILIPSVELNALALNRTQEHRVGNIDGRVRYLHFSDLSADAFELLNESSNFSEDALLLG